MHSRHLLASLGLFLLAPMALAAPQKIGFDDTLVAKAKVKTLYRSTASPFKKCGSSGVVVGEALSFELSEDMFMSVRIVESGSISAIGIEHMGSRATECDHSRVIRRKFKKGRYSVYGIGSPKALKKVFTVEVKTKKRPKAKKKAEVKTSPKKEVVQGQSAKRPFRVMDNLESLDEDAQEIAFKFGKSAPFSHSEKVSPDDDVFVKCEGSGGFNVHKMPLANAMKVSFDRPVNLVMWGDIKGGEYPTILLTHKGKSECIPVKEEGPLRITDSGDYFFRFGYLGSDVDGATKPVKRFAIAFAEKSRRETFNPLALNKSVKTGRFVNDFAPLAARGIQSNREALSELFAQIPVSARVYAKYDLDASLVTPKKWDLYNNYNPDEDKGRIFPKKDEALLWISGPRRTYLLTADGELYKEAEGIDAASDKPEGDALLPTKMRNVDLLFEELAPLASRRLVKRVAAHQKRSERLDDCWSKFYKGKGGSRDLELVTYQNGRVTSVKNWGDVVGRQADRKCGASKVAKAEVTLMKALLKEFNARGRARLKGMAR